MPDQTIKCPIGNRSICLGILVYILLSWNANIYAEQKLNVYYGLLHAHTFYSDGDGTPQEAYQCAKDVGLDFFAVTPHNHFKAESGAKERTDGVLIAKNHELYNGTDELEITRKWKKDGVVIRTETIRAKSIIQAANTIMDQDFIALYGQEFSTISSGNHINVFDIKEVLEVDNGNFSNLYKKLDNMVKGGKSPPIVQLNHPDVQQDLFYKGSKNKILKKMNNDYGIDNGDLGPHFEHLVVVSDPYVCFIEILSGPAMKKSRIENYHYEHTHENDYYFYLLQGFHISPSAGQDNHYKTWGNVTDARIGVLCSNLTKDNLLQAIRDNRTFATEDKNLSLRLSINDAVMGSVLTLDNEDLDIVACIEDEDEPNTEYEISLYYGVVSPEHRDQATNWKASYGLQEKKELENDGQVKFEGYISSGEPEFFYVKVTQNGQDRAWSAPIWINHPKPQASAPLYVWSASKSSKVYYYANCKMANNISQKNFRSGKIPPSDRRLHTGCKPLEIGEETH